MSYKHGQLSDKAIRPSNPATEKRGGRSVLGITILADLVEATECQLIDKIGLSGTMKIT